MIVGRHASAWALGLGLTTALVSAVQAAPARRHAASDTRDARIEALESTVRDLAAEVKALRADRLAAASVTAAAPTPSTAGARMAADAGSAGPPSTPDTPRPVTTAAAAPAGGASILAGKPSITSPDGRFAANLHGVVQFDAADYFQDHARPATVDLRRGGAAADTARARDLNDGTDFRRARIGVDGKVFGDFEYNVLFEFGGAGAEDAGHVQEAWLQYSGLKPFHLRIGAFRPSEGLEDQGSTNGMPFLERPAIVDTAASLAGADFREGAQLWATGERWFASGLITSRTVGVINSTATGGTQAFDTGLGFIGRLAVIPFKNDDWLTHLGVHGSYAHQVADVGGPDAATTTARYPIQFRERPELRVDGTRLVDTGAIDAEHGRTGGFEGAAQWRNLLVQGEVESLGIDRRNSLLSDPDFSGYYVEGTWILTGERRRFNPNTFAFDAPPVDHPFDWSAKTWGAWEVAMRYSDLDLNHHQGVAGQPAPADGVRGGDQRIYTAGVNWYLNPIVRFMLDYQHVDIRRLSPNAATFATPVGAQVGQTYDTLSVRSQLAF